MEKRPFAGVKILDFTWVGVGAFTVNNLVFYGATAIKVETTTRPDPVRRMIPYKDDAPRLESSYYWHFSQVAKRYDITLNLNHPKSSEIVRRLVVWADIVIESFAGGTMERWGLDYANLKEIKPDIIMLRTCMHGQTGPLATQPGHGNVLTALSGFDALTGWPDRPKSSLSRAFTDFVAPLYNTTCLIAALDYRRRTGKGQYLDLSQHEASMHCLGPHILDYVVNQRELETKGNRLDYAAPHGIYRCKGADRWCAIAVFTDAEWTSFCGVIGNPAWTDNSKFATLLNRKRNEDELDNLVEEWTSMHTAENVMTMMQAAGVGAGLAANIKDMREDPQLKHYHGFHEVDHPEMGKLSFCHRPGFTLSEASCERDRAPLLGEHNDYVYSKILGIPDEEFVQLMQEGVFD